MTETLLKAYKLLIIPGGNSITIGNNLKSSTTTNIRDAVTTDGLHFSLSVPAHSSAVIRSITA